MEHTMSKQSERYGRGIMIDQPKPFLGWNNPGKVLITGASAGLGASYASELAQKGFDLVLLARRRDKLQDLAIRLEKKYSIRCEIISADLANREEIHKIADHLRQIDNLDLLINNAGFATIGDFADVPLEKSMRMFNLHMAAPLQFCHAALQGMLKRKRGAIINVSSMGAFTLTPGNVLYDATKSFLVTFTENLSLEVKDRGIRVQALCPGFTHTEFHEVGDFKSFDRSRIPEALWMMPDDVVKLSLQALEDSKRIVMVPGWKNRLSKCVILHSSIARRLLQKKVKEQGGK